MGGDETVARTRTPEIMADAAYAVLTSPSRCFTGRFLIDDEVLSSVGVADFDKYNVVPGTRQVDLVPDFFVP
jgi:citronellol/citronellal dehydrogenase